MINDYKYSSEAVAWSYAKQVLLKTSQNSRENTCAGVSFLLNLQGYAL